MRYSPCEATSRFPACVERSLLFVRPNIAEGVGIRKAYPTGDALLRSSLLPARRHRGRAESGRPALDRADAPDVRSGIGELGSQILATCAEPLVSEAAGL